MFNKHLFAKLLDMAKGKRSLNQYAQKSGVTSAHLSRLMRALLDVPPEAKTIKKLADHAHNNITYERLILAAGHIKPKGRENRFKELRNEYNKHPDELSNYLNISTEEYLLIEELGQNVDFEYVKLLSDLYGKSIDYMLGFKDEEEHILDPFKIFELVEQYTDDEIIQNFRHVAEGKELDEHTIRQHLSYVRFLKQKKEQT